MLGRAKDLPVFGPWTAEKPMGASRRRIGVFAGAVCTSAWAGCEAAPEASGVYQLGDTIVVVSSAPLITDTIELSEISRVGRPDGDPVYLFTRVNAFVAGFDGSLFVHDDDDGIRHFDPDGRFVRYLAREGQGPAEVRYLLGLDADREGRLAAFDLGNARVSVFDTRSDEVFSFRRPRLRPRYGDGSIRIHNDGSIWVGVHPDVPDQGGIPHPRLAFIQYRMDGTPGDSLRTPPGSGDACTTLSEADYRVGYWEDRREPFLPKTTWSFGPDGTFAVGCPVDYSFDVLRTDGTVLRVERVWEPLLMTDEAQRRMDRQSGLSPPPKRRPAYGRIILPGDGRIWVWPNQPIEEYELNARSRELTGRTHGMRISTKGAFDVFRPDGRWLATVKVPDEVPFSGFPTEKSLLIRGDTVWALAVDSFQVQYVVRYLADGLGRTEP